jgi:hypothetical protein
VHRAAEALLPQPPIAWIVEELISRPSVSLVVGDPGSKKTYSLLDLGICIALGQPWLGFATHPCPVLFVDEESGVARINRRLGEIMHARAAGEETDFQYVSLAHLNLRKRKDVEALIALIKDTGAGILVIDTMADIMPGADENNVKDIQPIFLTLRRIADSTDCAIILIHHLNKNGGYRGSTALLGAVDLMLVVEGKAGSGDITFKVDKNRDGQLFDFGAVAEFSQDSFLLSPAGVRPKSKPSGKISRAKAYVLHYLATNGPALIKDICSRADVCSGEAARKATYELAKEGAVYRVDPGGLGTSARYDVTEEGRNLIGAGSV